jgi:hypothetical protein
VCQLAKAPPIFPRAQAGFWDLPFILGTLFAQKSRVPFLRVPGCERCERVVWSGAGDFDFNFNRGRLIAIFDQSRFSSSRFSSVLGCVYCYFMPRVSKSNVPAAALRWVVERAAHEFGLSTGTLRKALNRDSAEPDADGLFSTGQVVAALYGSMAAEKLATQKELRRKLELENSITTASVLNKDALMRGLSAIADAVVARITASGLSLEERQDILKDISSIPLSIAEVAARQSRLRVNGNGTHNGEEGATAG